MGIKAKKQAGKLSAASLVKISRSLNEDLEVGMKDQVDDDIHVMTIDPI